jgi:putative addiction module killer protein
MSESTPVTLERYVTPSGQVPFDTWLLGLRDRQARARVLIRLERFRQGNPGDTHPVGQGVWELRLDYGPGYRVYYAHHGPTIVLLLGGGDKATQQADIRRAQAAWHTYQQRR